MSASKQATKRWGLAAAIGLILLLAAYYLASPWVALARLKADAQARRADRMSQYIDFAAVRASIKVQWLARLQEEMPADGARQRLAAVGMALAGAVLEPAVHVLASPQGLIAMMNGENPLPGFDRLGIAVPKPANTDARVQAPPPAVPEASAAGQQAAEAQAASASTAARRLATAAAAPTAKRPWRLRYEGLNRVLIQRQPAQADEPYLLMRRRGLFGWQVVDVHLGRLW